MDGAALALGVRRRLGLEGLTDEQLDAAAGSATLYEHITAARDALVLSFAMSAPLVVQAAPFTLEVDGADDRVRTFPAATKDPMRVLVVRDATSGQELTPAARLNFDDGQYRWDTLRQLRLGDGVTADVELVAVLARAAIDATTTEAQVGLPLPCHRAIVLAGALNALTVDEESDGRATAALLAAELDKLERTYSEYDQNGGEALRNAFLASYGDWQGDSIS